MKRTPFVHIGIILAFLTSALGPFPSAEGEDFRLPQPGVIVHLSPPLDPPMLKGIKVYPDNPFKFDFILDRGDALPTRGHVPPPQRGYVSPSGEPSNKPLNTQAPQVNPPIDDQTLSAESAKLLKYFLASLTVPESDLWVNLSPYEKERIIPSSFGLTQMGRDLLAEDYILKQVTASLMYPEDGVGRRFWRRVLDPA